MIHSHGNAVRLYVFIDTLYEKSERPLLVIINRYKHIADLQKEFADKYYILYDEQYWVISNRCHSDDTEINHAIKNGRQFRNGYISYLCIITKDQKNNIPKFIDTYLEDLYSRVDVSLRWRDPTGDPIIIADSVDTKKPLPLIGWVCDACSFNNKAYKEWCDVCSSSRPLDYEIPKNYIWTEEDRKYIQQLEENNKKQLKMEKENIKKMDMERIEYRKKLELMYKEKVSYTTEASECPICMVDYEAGDSVILHSCLHTVCKDCLKAYLLAVTDPKVNCPTENCVGIIEDGEISGILTKEEYIKYEQLSLRTAESKTDNTFHCTTPNCTAWVVYDDDVNFFDCPLCKKQNCLLCKAIHEKQTCKDYQEEMVVKARNDEAAKKDLAFLENLIKTGEAMKCPKCKILIQKKKGCDWMMCNMCKTELCWATKGARWGPKGRGDISGGCRCMVNGKRCSRVCLFCH